jgi:hypothetical protein
LAAFGANAMQKRQECAQRRILRYTKYKKKMSFCTTVYIAIRGCQVKLMIARSSQIVIKHVAAQREFKFFRADHKLDAKMGEGRGGVCVLNWSHSGTAIEH